MEARHNAYLRASLSESPFPQNQDDALTPDEVHTMAHGFIVSCPSGNPTFPVKAFPGLTVTTTGTITSGQVIGIETDDYVLAPQDTMAHLYAAFVTVAGADWALLTPSGNGMSFQVTVPPGVNGQSYLLLSNCNTTITDDTVIAGPTFLEVSIMSCSSHNVLTFRTDHKQPAQLHLGMSLMRLVSCTHYHCWRREFWPFFQVSIRPRVQPR